MRLEMRQNASIDALVPCEVKRYTSYPDSSSSMRLRRASRAYRKVRECQKLDGRAYGGEGLSESEVLGRGENHIEGMSNAKAM